LSAGLHHLVCDLAAYLHHTSHLREISVHQVKEQAEIQDQSNENQNQTDCDGKQIAIARGGYCVHELVFLQATKSDCDKNT
jgi:hypothetical protein